MMPVDSDEHSGLIMEGPSDPDAQATVTDFIDYTEYLPADIVRSLTLIRNLDETYLREEATVHELTKIYGALPSYPPETQPRPIVLRKHISQHLSRAINAREAAYAEASRLYDLVDRHFDRLACIKSKLDALLESFDADSLAAQALAAAEAKRDRKAEERTPLPRLTLRFDPSRRPADGADKGRRATRADRIRFDPDTAIASTEHSGAEEEPKVTPAAAPKKKDATKRGKPNRRKTQSGATALEMSTAHALATLDPPPEDAVIGSEHLPWLRLSDWEMAKLRKKMKKNNLWQPSEIMINRELALRGRGWENYRAAKAKAEAEGTELLDCDDIPNNFIADTLLRKGEGDEGAAVVDRLKLSNRGMKLNEAKRLKRENLAREQAALAAAEAEMAAKRLGDIGSTFKSLFSSPAEQSPSTSAPSGFFGASSSSANNANGIPSKDRTKAKPPSKKRKLEETAAQETTEKPQQEEPMESPAAAPIAVSSATKPTSKRTKPNKDQPGSGTTTPTTIKLTLTTGGVSLSKKSTPIQSPVEPKRSSRRVSAASKAQPTPTPPVTRTESRRTSMSGAEPSGRELRKKSATPAAARVQAQAQAQDQAQPAPRRSKRPAPGPVTAGQDGGAAVSVGRRKAKPAPRKKKDHAARGSSQPQQDIRIDEDGVLEEIDANEPRYCLCGDVSFGTMICCEDNDVSSLLCFAPILNLLMLFCSYSATRSGSTSSASASATSPAAPQNGSAPTAGRRTTLLQPTGSSERADAVSSGRATVHGATGCTVGVLALNGRIGQKDSTVWNGRERSVMES